MSHHALPDVTYDAIVVGTGMVESIVSAALSRVGKKILHIDANDYYGSQYSTLGLDEFFALFDAKNAKQEQASSSNNNAYVITQQDPAVTVAIQQPSTSAIPITFAPTLCTTSADASATDAPQVTVDMLTAQDRKEVRRYAIDLYCTKLLYCYGPVVQSLVQSAIGRYLEFKCFDGVLVYVENSFQKVPCSKSEVFNNKFISLIEKRYLMKFMEFCMEQIKAKDPSEFPVLYKEFEHQPFLHLLKKFNLSARLQSFILYAIAMLDSDQDTSISTRDGLLRIRHYVLSLDRYGPSPFLYPMYGSSELSQAYCRVSAVYGSTFVLRRGLSQVYLSSTSDNSGASSSTVQGIKCSMGQDVLTQHLILNRDFVPTAATPATYNKKGESVLRCINVLNTPLLDPALYKTPNPNAPAPKVQYGAFIAVVPPKTFGAKQTHAITIVQMDNSASVVPRGKILVTFEMRGSDFDVLKECVNFFLKPQLAVEQQQQEESKVEAAATPTAALAVEQDAPTASSELPPQQAETQAVQQEEKEPQQIVYQLYYKYYNRTSVVDPEADKLFRAGNVYVADDIDCLSDMEGTVAKARSIFETICPNTDFLPRLPNPEEQEEAKNKVFDVAAKLLGVDKEMEQQLQQEAEKQQETSTAVEESKETTVPIQASNAPTAPAAASSDQKTNESSNNDAPAQNNN